jgi:hypothetical protein
MDLTFQSTDPDGDLLTANELCEALIRNGFNAALTEVAEAPEIILDDTERLVLETDFEGLVQSIILRVTAGADEQAADQLAASLDELGFEYLDEDLI